MLSNRTNTTKTLLSVLALGCVFTLIPPPTVAAKTVAFAATSPISLDEIVARTEPIDVNPDGLKTEPIDVNPDGLKTEPIDVNPDGLNLVESW